MQSIEDDVTCQICHGFFKQPKALPCIHSFCETCLRDYVFSRGFDATGHFPCPLCRADTGIPEGGVTGFPNNHLLQSLIDTLRQGGQITDSVSLPSNSPQKANRPNSRGDNINQTRPASASSNSRPSSTGRNGSASQPRRNPPLNMNPPSRPSEPPVLCVSNMGAYAAALDVPVMQDKYQAKVIFGKFGKGLAHFEKPAGVCFTNHYGETLIHVTDGRNTRVMSFKLEGRIHTIITTQGSFHGLTSDGINKLFIAVSNNANKEALVVSYDLKGTPKDKFGNMFSFITPNAVAYDKKFGHVIVTSAEEKQTYIFNKTGKMLQKFGKKGNGPDAFLAPLHVALNRYSQIIVSDCESHCLKVFDRHGKSKFVIGSKGRGNGQLLEPRGVAVDNHNNIIVADAGNQRIQIFNAAGKFVEIFLNELNQQGFPDSCEVYPDSLAVQGNWLAVLYKGKEFAQVRVYEYHSSGSGPTNRQLSSACVCQ